MDNNLSDNRQMQRQMQSKLERTPEVSHDELFRAFMALQNYFYLLYMAYSTYFEITGLALLAYLSYKLGKISVREPVDKKVKELSYLMKTQKYLRSNLPKLTLQHSRTKRITIWVIILYGVALGVGTYLGKIPQLYLNQVWYSYVLIIMLGGVAIYSWQAVLIRRQNKMRQSDTIIVNKTKQFVDQLGPKVQNTLRNSISKEAIAKSRKPKATTCERKACQELRALYRERYESTRQFVQSVLGFQWCSQCKKRRPFDEMLSFEPPVFNNKSDNEQQEVKQKLNYLIEGMREMIKWVETVGPCNCSKLYWALSTKEILQYKHAQKRINEALKQLQRKYSVIVK